MLNISFQKGVSVLFAVIIMTIILAIGLGISAILLTQFKTIGEIGNSVRAFYAADSGVEETLYYIYNPSEGDPHVNDPQNLGGGYYYEITEARCGHLINPSEGDNCPMGFDCSGDPCCAGGEEGCPKNYYFKSIGIYKNTRRAIEVEY